MGLARSIAKLMSSGLFLSFDWGILLAIFG
ncbi:hypothetical protein TH47_06135 [Thalassospira sp. MCCC 1A02803]|nr:hypothetical protein TH47_06135 [Thalassospira sp. MCCC 1A02803]